MNDIKNVFEHQLFRLRTPDGQSVSKSFKQLMTEPDAPYALDYAQAFYDVAALNLMTFLAQLAFEPENADELVQQLESPMSEEAYKTGVSPLRARCALNGEGPRFMQAPGPFEEKKKASGIDVAVFISAKGDRQFLHRANDEWAVPVDQAGLFLFARNTFFEGTAGRGYQKGTNGDTPVRVYLSWTAEHETMWLRRTIWMNVLSRHQQRQYPGAFADAKSLRDGQYDGLFWERPPIDDIPVGGVTLRAGLGWMSAYHWLWYEDNEGICPLTGEIVSGTVARAASKKSTGIGYGTAGDLESGARADRLFRHPNVPNQKRWDNKTKEFVGEIPTTVQRLEGLAGAIGATFFGGRSASDGAAYVLAPVVDQSYVDVLQKWFLRSRRTPSANVFGFHMLSNQKNVHGGIEQDSFSLPLFGKDPLEIAEINEVASGILYRASTFAEDASRRLAQAVQRTVGAGVRAEVGEDGSIRLKNKLESTPSVEDPFGRDVLATYWRSVRNMLSDLAGVVASDAKDGHAHLSDLSDKRIGDFEEGLIREIRLLYRPVFEQYSTLPRTMPYAHTANRMLNSALKKIRTFQPETV